MPGIVHFSRQILFTGASGPICVIGPENHPAGRQRSLELEAGQAKSCQPANSNFAVAGTFPTARLAAGPDGTAAAAVGKAVAKINVL